MEYKYGVPDAISNLTNLVEFDCSYTYFSGALRPAPFSTLSNLLYLDLEGNFYNSTIPSVLSTLLPNLKYLYAGNGLITGDLSFAKGMPNIRDLWVDSNYLGGTLPTFLGNLTTLETLALSYNSFSGPLPSQLGQLPYLIKLWLYANKFSGTIPTSFTKLSYLKIFHVEDNNMKGNVSALCEALVYPTESLTSLGVDCGGGSSAKVVCPSSCKICCCNLTACNDGALVSR
jgi:Leucine-rich repeat (LRR) protein